MIIITIRVLLLLILVFTEYILEQINANKLIKYDLLIKLIYILLLSFAVIISKFDIISAIIYVLIIYEFVDKVNSYEIYETFIDLMEKKI